MLLAVIQPTAAGLQDPLQHCKCAPDQDAQQLSFLLIIAAVDGESMLVPKCINPSDLDDILFKEPHIPFQAQWTSE
jgi:hypothetical protein